MTACCSFCKRELPRAELTELPEHRGERKLICEPCAARTLNSLIALCREVETVNKLRRTALLSSQTSRRNKIALLAQYAAEGEPVTWAWKGEPYESRLMVSIDAAPMQECKSYDEDVKPLLKDN